MCVQAGKEAAVNWVRYIGAYSRGIIVAESSSLTFISFPCFSWDIETTQAPLIPDLMHSLGIRWKEEEGL